MASLEMSQRINRQAPQLVTVLKEMKAGLDTVSLKVQFLIAKVKADHFPTADGLSYLETKHLLLLNYCQSLVHYLLRKAKGLSIEGHPVVRSLVEMRLFLEKIRPIDKKMQYQIQKLTRDSDIASEKSVISGKGTGTQKEDLLKYRPKPDMLVRKTSNTTEDGANVYRPPKFAPASMGEEKMSKQERNDLRREKERLRNAKQSPYMVDLLNDLEGRPEEVREEVGNESRELRSYIAKMEERAKREEEAFDRAPLTKLEKKKMKHLKKSRNGLLGLTDSFYDEIKSLPLGEPVSERSENFEDGSAGIKRQKKRQRRN